MPGANPQPDAAIELPSGISGHVRVNGQPFAGAELRIYLLAPGGPPYPFNPPTATALTDADGNYAALGIPAGQYVVDLYINGQIQPPSQQATVSPGRPTRERRLRHQHRPADDAGADDGGADHAPRRPRRRRRRRHRRHARATAERIGAPLP